VVLQHGGLGPVQGQLEVVILTEYTAEMSCRGFVRCVSCSYRPMTSVVWHRQVAVLMVYTLLYWNINCVLGCVRHSVPHDDLQELERPGYYIGSVVYLVVKFQSVMCRVIEMRHGAATSLWFVKDGGLLSVLWIE
jgi:hypothetical protein